MSDLWPIMMLVGLVAGIFSGYPVAFVLAGIGILFALAAGVPLLFLSTGVSRMFSGVLTNWLLVAIPLFVFMGLMLERSGIAARLLRSLAGVFGRLPGGYAYAVAIIGIIMAASTGIIGASVVLMGMLALPAMMKAKYDPGLASGLIAASGTLGILIPPSVMLIVLGDQLRLSVGDLFMGAMVPGLMLGLMYLVYVVLVAVFRPQAMPAPEMEQRGPWLAGLMQLGRDLLAPVALVAAVLGSIAAGIATPTEAAGIGALGATLLAAFTGQLSLSRLREAVNETTRTTAMILFVMLGATIFSLVFRKLGGDTLIADAFSSHGDRPYVVFLTIMGLVFLFGFFLDWVEIALVVVPIVAPIIADLDFGLTREQTLLWFAIAFAVNLQTSFLTPPFGYALFYLRGIAPPGVSIGTIYRGVIPFVIIQIIALLLVIFFPDLALWLPSHSGD